MSQQAGDGFVITSDRSEGSIPTKVVPRKRLSDIHQVWTGEGWSASKEAAAVFSTLDLADEYIRVNLDRLLQ